LRNTIAGTYDKFDTNAVSTAFADALGKEETASIVFGTLSKGGSITTVEDITSRTDLDADGKTIMFKFIDAENQMITAALENPYDRLSVLTNTKKFASNGKQYTFTYDEADAKANPEKVLLKVDSATGQPTPQFNDEQMKVSNEAMRTEVRAKYDYKKGVSQTAQAQLQESSEGARTARADAKAADAAAGYWNQLYTGKTAAEKKAAADTLLGTPIAQEAGLLGIDLSQNGKIKLTYADPVKNRTIDYLDANNNPVSLRDFSGLGVELHGVVDRDKAVKAGGGGTGFGKVNDLATVTSQRQGAAPVPVKTTIPVSAIEMSSTQAAVSIQESVGDGFIVKDLTPGALQGNRVKVTSVATGKTFTINTKIKGDAANNAKKDLQDFVNLNKVATETKEGEASGTAAAGTSNLNASNRKPQ
jgi:hypothetical protein